MSRFRSQLRHLIHGADPIRLILWSRICVVTGRAAAFSKWPEHSAVAYYRSESRRIKKGWLAANLHAAPSRPATLPSPCDFFATCNPTLGSTWTFNRPEPVAMIDLSQLASRSCTSPISNVSHLKSARAKSETSVKPTSHHNPHSTNSFSWPSNPNREHRIGRGNTLKQTSRKTTNLHRRRGSSRRKNITLRPTSRLQNSGIASRRCGSLVEPWENSIDGIILAVMLVLQRQHRSLYINS